MGKTSLQGADALTKAKGTSPDPRTEIRNGFYDPGIDFKTL